MVEGDKRLFNQYGVMLVNPAKHPAGEGGRRPGLHRLADLEDGQTAIAGYKIDGQQLFFPDAAPNTN